MMISGLRRWLCGDPSRLDCVASTYGDDLHVLGLQNVSRCLGWVLSNEQFRERIESAEHEMVAAVAS
jgi:hypothetical protein